METKKLKKNALFNPEGDTETRLRILSYAVRSAGVRWG